MEIEQSTDQVTPCDSSNTSAEQIYSLVEAFLKSLGETGMLLSSVELETLRIHLRELVQSFSPSDDSSPWFVHSKPGAMLDGHLLLAGLSELTMRDNVIIFGCNSAQFFMAGAKKIGRDQVEEECMTENIRNCISQAWRNRNVAPSFLIPVNIRKSHWGAIFGVAGPENEAHGNIFWGDSLRWNCPDNLLNFVAKFFTETCRNIKWTVQAQNYILDELSFKLQKDIYSCGFYVLCAASGFAEATLQRTMSGY